MFKSSMTKILTVILATAVLTVIGDAVSCSCPLKNVTIPASVTEIGEEAFQNCTSLTDVTIPDSVTKICDNAFEFCDDLTINGKKGSAAETYAKNNNIKFAAK